MDEQNINPEASDDEQNADTEAMAEVKEEDVRDKLAEDLGLDPDEDSELLDKLTSRELDHSKKLFTAIKQKRNWRDKAKSGTTSKKDDQTKSDESNAQPGNLMTPEQVEKMVSQRFEERDLKSLNLPEEVETEVRSLAEFKGISVREAAETDYIKSVKESYEKKARTLAASPKRKGKGSYAKRDFDPTKPLDPSNYDLNSEEGRKAWERDRALRR